MAIPRTCVHAASRHIHHLAEGIGGRGSCTPAEYQAAEYVAQEMDNLGVTSVKLEPFQALPSTYWPYALAFAAALLGTFLAWIPGDRWAMAAASLLNAMGAWGMLAETDFAANWMRCLLPRATSHNAVGVLPASGESRCAVVLCAHLDTHRTPIFYSSRTWHTLFGALVAAAFVSMAAEAVAYGLGAVLGWDGLRWLGLAASMQVFALLLCLHADRTPFSPGANDNASGVGVVLGLAEQLAREPLNHTDVWLVFTGCEEVAAYGMAAFLDAHAAELGDAVYVVLDQVGVGRLVYLTADGLILKRKTHPQALGLARQASAALPDVQTTERVGIAYTDAAVATKRGLSALTVVALPPSGDEATHWHQMSDIPNHIDETSLADACAFARQVLHQVDNHLPS
ncbi:MAG: M28 family peptidase [Anaerolineae bacterium]